MHPVLAYFCFLIGSIKSRFRISNRIEDQQVLPPCFPIASIKSSCFRFLNINRTKSLVFAFQSNRSIESRFRFTIDLRHTKSRPLFSTELLHDKYYYNIVQVWRYYYYYYSASYFLSVFLRPASILLTGESTGVANARL